MNGTKKVRSIARRPHRAAAPKTRLKPRQRSKVVRRPSKQAPSQNRVVVAWCGVKLHATGTSGFLVAVVVIVAILVVVLGEHARGAGLVLLALAHEPRG